MPLGLAKAMADQWTRENLLKYDFKIKQLKSYQIAV